VSMQTHKSEAPCFRSLRPGFLGAFPADGCLHPVIRRAAEALQLRLPGVLRGLPLARWWLFKYSSAALGYGQIGSRKVGSLRIVSLPGIFG